MTQEPENFDRLLDQALQSYSAAEPRFGLENRILARTAAQPAARQFPGLLTRGLLWIGLAAICFAIAATVSLSHRRSPEKKQEIAQHIPSSHSEPRPYPAVRSRSTPHIERAAMRHRHHTASPQYGQPQPTQQDRLFVQFVAFHHQDAVNLAMQQQTPDQPIASTPLPIDPIVSPPIVIAPITMDSKDQASF